MLYTALRIAENLERVYREIKAIAPNALVIWASTTAVNDAYVGTDNATIDIYNARAAEVMAKFGVPVNDLNAVVKSNIKEYISNDFLHLSEAGVKACALAVVDCVKTHI